jgi:hypothetical protein
MTPEQLLVFAIIVFGLLVVGIALTISEFKDMAKNKTPDNR